MVKSFTLTAAEHRSYLSGDRTPCVPNEPHAYPSRSTNLKQESVTLYRDLLINLMETEMLPAERERFTSHCTQIMDELDMFDRNDPPLRYEAVYPGILRDSAFALEAAGLMLAAKYYQQVFDVSRHFSALLAFIIGEPLSQVDTVLRSNCQRLGIDYDNLSIAICSMDSYLLPSMDLRCFNGIASSLDQVITNMVKFPNKCLYNVGYEYLDLRDPKITPAQRFTTFLTFQIVTLSQHIFDFIIRDYEAESNRACMLVSKSTSSLIFQGNKAIVRPTFEVTLRDIKIVLEPQLVQSGSYIKLFMKGCL